MKKTCPKKAELGLERRKQRAEMEEMGIRGEKPMMHRSILGSDARLFQGAPNGKICNRFCGTTAKQASEPLRNAEMGCFPRTIVRNSIMLGMCWTGAGQNINFSRCYLRKSNRRMKAVNLRSTGTLNRLLTAILHQCALLGSETAHRQAVRSSVLSRANISLTLPVTDYGAYV